MLSPRYQLRGFPTNTEEQLFMLLLRSFLPCWYPHWSPLVLTILLGICPNFCTWKERCTTVTTNSSCFDERDLKPCSHCYIILQRNKENIYAITAVLAQRFSDYLIKVCSTEDTGSIHDSANTGILLYAITGHHLCWPRTTSTSSMCTPCCPRRASG